MMNSISRHYLFSRQSLGTIPQVLMKLTNTTKTLLSFQRITKLEEDTQRKTEGSVEQF